MVRPERANWLDKAIAETVPGEPPQPDFAAWRRAHPEALEALAQRAPRKTQSQAGLPAVIEFGRRIMRSPITKLAVAAALIVGIFILTNHLTGRETPVPEPRPTLVENVPTVEPQEERDTAQDELVLAQTLYGQGNTTGLLSLLQTGQNETKMKVAEYLGQIGDRSVLSALQTLATQWQGAPDANPFQKAIERIREQQDQPTKPESSIPEPSGPSGTHTQGAQAASARTVAQQSLEQSPTNVDFVTYEGRVTNETGDPVPNVHVWGQILSSTLRNSIFAQETSTDSDGKFELSATRPVDGRETLRVLHFDHPDYGMGWLTLGPQQAYSEWLSPV